MTYKAPTAQIDFILTHVVPFADLARTDRFAEATAETATAILSEAGKLAQNVLAPLNRGSDQTPARLENWSGGWLGSTGASSTRQPAAVRTSVTVSGTS